MTVPQKYFRNNVVGTMSLLEAAMAARVSKFIFSSSCATYGIPEQSPISESQVQRPVNPYGESKLMIEKALLWYGRTCGLKSVSLRYFNAAGADPEGDIGEVHDPETHILPLVIGAALGVRPPVDVYGTDYATPDGTAIRDYTHVSDIARAHVLALRYLLDGAPSTALNLGTGKGRSVLEVLGAVERVSGRRVPFRMRERREGDPPLLVAGPICSRKSSGVAGRVRSALRHRSFSLELALAVGCRCASATAGSRGRCCWIAPIASWEQNDAEPRCATKAL